MVLCNDSNYGILWAHLLNKPESKIIETWSSLKQWISNNCYTKNNSPVINPGGSTDICQFVTNSQTITKQNWRAVD